MLSLPDATLSMIINNCKLRLDLCCGHVRELLSFLSIDPFYVLRFLNGKHHHLQPACLHSITDEAPDWRVRLSDTQQAKAPASSCLTVSDWFVNWCFLCLWSSFGQRSTNENTDFLFLFIKRWVILLITTLGHLLWTCYVSPLEPNLTTQCILKVHSVAVTELWITRDLHQQMGVLQSTLYLPLLVSIKSRIPSFASTDIVFFLVIISQEAGFSLIARIHVSKFRHNWLLQYTCGHVTRYSKSPIHR